MTPTERTLRDTINRYLGDTGMSISELARRIECHASSLTRYLQGRQKKIDGEAVHRFYEMLGKQNAGEDFDDARGVIWSRIALHLRDLADDLESELSDDDKTELLSVEIDRLYGRQKALRAKLRKRDD